MRYSPFLFLVAFSFCLFFLPSSSQCEMHYITVLSTGNLEKEQIKLKVENTEASVEEFFLVDVESPTPEMLQHPAGRRQYFLVFDLIFSSPEAILEARNRAFSLFQFRRPGDLFAILAITRKEGLKMFGNLTADPNQFILALDSLVMQKKDFLEGPEGFFYSSNWEQTMETVPLPEMQFLHGLKSYELSKEKKEQDRFLFVQALVDVAFLLSTVEGRKNLVLFATGFDTGNISLALDLEKKRKMATDGGEKEMQIQSLDNLTNTYRNWEELAQQGGVRRVREQGVEVIPGLFQGSDTAVHVYPLGKDNGFFHSLAEKTRGLYGKQEATAEKILSLDRQYYVVGWRMQKEKDREEFRQLSPLHVSAPGQELKAPEKFLFPRTYQEYTPIDHRLAISEGIYKNYSIHSNDHYFWADFLFQSGRAMIPAFVQISGNYLLTRGKDLFTLECYGYATDGNQILDFFAVPVELDLGNNKLRERLQKSGLKIWGVLLAPKKRVEVRWVLVERNRGVMLSTSLPVDIRQAEMTITNPFVPSTNFDWIIWPPPGEEQKKRGISIPYPYRLGNSPFFPDLTPALSVTGKNQVVYFKIYNLLPENPHPPVRMQLLNDSGKPAAEIKDFLLLQKPRELEQSGIELFWALPTIPALTPGQYRLRVGVADLQKSKTIIREIRTLHIRS